MKLKKLYAVRESLYSIDNNKITRTSKDGWCTYFQSSDIDEDCIIVTEDGEMTATAGDTIVSIWAGKDHYLLVNGNTPYSVIHNWRLEKEAWSKEKREQEKNIINPKDCNDPVSN